MPNRNVRASRLQRRSRPVSLTPLFALAILAVGIAYAQQNLPVPPAKPAATPATAPAAAAPAGATGTAPAGAAPADDANTGDTAPLPPPSAAAGKGSPQRFEP